MGQENPNDQPPPPPPTLWQRISERFRKTPGSGLAFAVVPLVVLGYFGWYYYGAEHLDRTLYALKLENIELTQQPPWIHTDLKNQVFRDNRLSQLSLLDPTASATIAHAFDAHIWIKHTNRVSKLSGGKVVVDVTYRRPAAMVYYDQATSSATGGVKGKGKCFPIDDEGVVLPSDEFAPEQVHDYLMIFAPNAAPAGAVGMAFGDPRISEALVLCKLLEHLRVQLRLACIHVEPDAIDQHLGGFNSWVMLIQTEDNREVLWGHAPGKENKDEMNVQEKLATMKAWLSASPASSDVAVLNLLQRRNIGQRLITTPPVQPQ